MMSIDEIRKMVVEVESLHKSFISSYTGMYFEKIDTQFKILCRLLNKELKNCEINLQYFYICGKCGMTVLIPKNTCSRCPQCFEKIGSCDE